MSRTTITVTSESRVSKVVALLVARSAWFEVTPLPDDRWDISFKAGEGIEKAIRGCGEFLRVIHAGTDNEYVEDSPGVGKVLYHGREVATLSYTEDYRWGELYAASPALLAACRALLHNDPISARQLANTVIERLQ